MSARARRIPFGQAWLFPPFQAESATSREAADAILPDTNYLRGLVLAFLLGRGDLGATDEEIREALGLAGSTARPRRIELREMGLVHDSGRERRLHSGRNGRIWIAKLPQAATAS